jgi:DNA-directed RNA polymerase subunit RPC12/RpoP
MSERFAALNAGHSYNFSVNKVPKCPHCGSDFDIDRNEAWFLYDENDTHEVECPSCGGGYQVRSLAIWMFSTDEQGRRTGCE